MAEAARSWTEHVVITCVTRDDLPDGGAEHFARTIAEIRDKGVRVFILTQKGGQSPCAEHPEGRSGKWGLSPFSPHHRGPALRLRRQPVGGRSADRRGPGGLQPQHRDRAAAVSRRPR